METGKQVLLKGGKSGIIVYINLEITDRAAKTWVFAAFSFLKKTVMRGAP